MLMRQGWVVNYLQTNTHTQKRDIPRVGKPYQGVKSSLSTCCYVACELRMPFYSSQLLKNITSRKFLTSESYMKFRFLCNK